MSNNDQSDILRKEIGERLQRLRQQQGATQQELAEVLKIDRSALARIEVGDRQFTVIELIRASRALEMTPSELMDKLTSDFSHR